MFGEQVDHRLGAELTHSILRPALPSLTTRSVPSLTSAANAPAASLRSATSSGVTRRTNSSAAAGSKTYRASYTSASVVPDICSNNPKSLAAKEVSSEYTSTPLRETPTHHDQRFAFQDSERLAQRRPRNPELRDQLHLGWQRVTAVSG